MKPFTRTTALLVAAVLQAACQDPGRATAPDAAAPGVLASEGHATDGTVHVVNLLDECEHESFNRAIGPGTCNRARGVKFEKFVAQLQQFQVAFGWRFSPTTVDMKVGETLVGWNRGGEVHTFTEVEHYGGGVVPLLNDLSGNPVPAAECLALAPDEFLAPGARDTDVEEEPGTELYQCCIHPWMRAVVHIHEG